MTSARRWPRTTNRRSLPCSPRPRGSAMLWEVEIRPKGADRERERITAENDLLTHGAGAGARLIQGAARGYLLEGAVDRDQAQRLVDELLVDPRVAPARLVEITAAPAPGAGPA